jgi:hypothetical protein
MAATARGAIRELLEQTMTTMDALPAASDDEPGRSPRTRRPAAESRQKLTRTPPQPAMGAPGATNRCTAMGLAKALKLSAPPVA